MTNDQVPMTTWSSTLSTKDSTRGSGQCAEDNVRRTMWSRREWPSNAPMARHVGTLVIRDWSFIDHWSFHSVLGHFHHRLRLRSQTRRAMAKLLTKRMSAI